MRTFQLQGINSWWITGGFQLHKGHLIEWHPTGPRLEDRSTGPVWGAVGPTRCQRCPPGRSMIAPEGEQWIPVTLALQCKAKRRYLLTLQVSRYRLLALQSGAPPPSERGLPMLVPKSAALRRRRACASCCLSVARGLNCWRTNSITPAGYCSNICPQHASGKYLDWGRYWPALTLIESRTSKVAWEWRGRLNRRLLPRDFDFIGKSRVPELFNSWWTEEWCWY